MKIRWCRPRRDHIAAGKIVGWFQGRVDNGGRERWAAPAFWPIRGCAEMKEILNRRIKHRENFPPLCALDISRKQCTEYFERSDPSPFMTFAYSVRPEKRGG